MPHLITRKCINCGYCESICPTNAIYADGEPWSISQIENEHEIVLYNGEKISNNELQPPISEESYFIVPDKCNDCAKDTKILCVSVCPIEECIIPDLDLLNPQNSESSNNNFGESKKLIPVNQENHTESRTQKNSNSLGALENHEDLNRLKQRVKELIRNNKLNQAISEAQTNLGKVNPGLFNEIYVLESQLKELDKEYNRKGTISFEDFRRNNTIIVHRFLSIIDEI